MAAATSDARHLLVSCSRKSPSSFEHHGCPASFNSPRYRREPVFRGRSRPSPTVLDHAELPEPHFKSLPVFLHDDAALNLSRRPLFFSCNASATSSSSCREPAAHPRRRLDRASPPRAFIGDPRRSRESPAGPRQARDKSLPRRVFLITFRSSSPRRSSAATPRHACAPASSASKPCFDCREERAPRPPIDEPPRRPLSSFMASAAAALRARYKTSPLPRSHLAPPPSLALPSPPAHRARPPSSSTPSPSPSPAVAIFPASSEVALHLAPLSASWNRARPAPAHGSSPR